MKSTLFGLTITFFIVIKYTILYFFFLLLLFYISLKTKSKEKIHLTSSGKEAVNATLPSGLVMCRAIRDYYALSGRKVSSFAIYRPIINMLKIM